MTKSTLDLHYIELLTTCPEKIKGELTTLDLDFEASPRGNHWFLAIYGGYDQVADAADRLDLERDEISVW